MCGIAGFLEGRQRRPDADATAVAWAMTDALAHRGPDDRGIWCDAPHGLALGSRRLAIQDPTPRGHQPMASSCGRYTIAFNGEIYDFRRLARELGGSFATGTDTEVLLAAVAAWGLERALTRSNGMYAFALWDRSERALTLVRDRMGQKPLYWAETTGGALLFASEPRSFWHFPGFQPEIDRDAASLLFRRMSIPAPYSILRGVRKLEPGSWLRAAVAEDGSVRLSQGTWWSTQAVLEAGARDPLPGGREAAAEALEPLLADAVELCSIADVPLGAFLSGGIDSSLVVALLQRASARPVRTFTIGFRDRSYDETAHAARVAAALGTDHTTLEVGERELLEVVPQLPRLYDEPLADSSQIPTYLVCRLARPHVTVALTGDGGDELFGGYAHYRQYQRLLRLSRLPRPLVRMATGTLARLPLPQAPRLAAALGLRDQGFSDGLRKLDSLLEQARTPQEIYLHVISTWKNGGPVRGAVEPPTLAADVGQWPKIAPPLAQAMAVDAVTYLHDDVLTKVDRAAMAASLETRIPLLDHRIVELAARLPIAIRWQSGRGKLPLRDLLARHLDPRLFERPKRGFSVPLSRWLRNELRPWAEELLDERRLDEGGLIDPPPVRQMWREHLAGEANWAGYLWPVLTLESWRRAWRAAPAALPATSDLHATGVAG
ncbi:MAG TPA: asparagine synthase (glutamine-hydrolyzing) [Thermoanaerobaculia bacterium]|nr:asparagine synthase (glutamine-hydrolyzing) [Thermoanaerobaculia bacterium]